MKILAAVRGALFPNSNEEILMSKVETEMPTPKKPRAPAIAEKLEAARAVLASFNGEVAQAVLDAAENAPGAPKKLFDVRAKISAAEREVIELEKAYALATRLDRQADAAGAAMMRAEQFEVMKKSADVRLTALASIMEAIETAARAYSEYSLATNDMVVALPTGTRLGFVALGKNGYAGSWVGDLKQLIAAEAYRLTVIDDQGRGARLPFAEQPELTSSDHTKLPAGLDLMREATESILRDVEAQMNRLNDEQMQRAAGLAA